MTTAEQDKVTSNITSIFSAGAFWGAVFAFFLLELAGRRISVLVADITFIVGAILCVVSNGRLSMIYGGRVLSGIGVGGFVSIIPIYISELSPPAIRGRMTGFFETFYQAGSLVGFWINYGIESHMDTNLSKSWRIPMAVQLIPVGIVLFATPFLVESPTWLLKKNRDEEALRAFATIRNLHVSDLYVLEDFGYVKAQIQIERSVASHGENELSFWGVLKSMLKEATMKGMRNRFGLVSMLCLLQAWSGAVAINYYSPTIFRSIGLENVTLYTGIYGVIKSVASMIFFSVFIDMTGRKWPWFVSSACCSVCMYFMGGYVAIVHPATGDLQSSSDVAVGKAAAAAIMIFGFVWSFGANGLPLIISSEIFSPSVRSISGPWAGMNIWLWSFVVTKSLPSMYTSMGYGVYLFFGTILVLSATFAFFCIPETKGLRMDQMDELFGALGNRDVELTESAMKEEKSIALEIEEAV